MLTIISIVAFFGFGVYLIYEGCTEEEEELEDRFKEVEDELNSSLSHYESQLHGEGEDDEYTPLDGKKEAKRASGFSKFWATLMMNASLRLFAAVMVSEMGDRSQITAIALAASYPVTVVIIGGILGHFVAMLLAIIAGTIISKHVSEATTAVIGGVLFILFSVYELVFEIILNS